ncbi:DUF4267 domain-containing protein [Nocardia sp. NEAU-G5]|uniref:DUF4267 domain-containing protein n=1 Tax=Nocardia albiluteola TaxID=2842303 RepID=A0ABS6BB39_9NOCA|nr:DUF4267 domain-containing protein [Nocardia albiluteola]MBU3067005.1 DUF4267 domain-containing protein [Nocardia albiluteola]
MSVDSSTESVVSVRSSRSLGDRLGTAGAILGAGFIISVGGGYLLAPEKMAAGFGLPAWPSGEADGFLNVKGVRDVVTGLMMLVPLATGQRRTLGATMLTVALIPTGDMLTILVRRGSTATALKVHGFTAALVAASGALLMRRENR